MKIGNISQTVLKRSVLKQLHTTREEMLWNPSVEEMCSGVELSDGDTLMLSSSVIYGDEKDLGYFGIAKAVNDIASRGAKPIGVEVEIQLPPYAYESRLKSMVGHMEACCQQLGIQMMGVQASVCPVIRSAVIYATAVGSVYKDNTIQTSNGKSGMDILLLNGVGTEGAIRIYNKKEDDIGHRFIPSFFDGLRKCKERILIVEPIQQAIKEGAVAIHQLDEGGILAALWKLGEAANVGLELDLKKMTIRQDVIEICEFVGVNPYQLSAIGSALIVIQDGVALQEILRKDGFSCEIIGKTTSGNERVIFNGGEKRFLDRPTQGELLKLYESEGELHA